MKVTTNQSIVTINIQKIRSREGEPPSPKNALEDQSSKSQEILIPAPEVSLKNTPKNFHGGQFVNIFQNGKNSHQIN